MNKFMKLLERLERTNYESKEAETTELNYVCDIIDVAKKQEMNFMVITLTAWGKEVYWFKTEEEAKAFEPLNEYKVQIVSTFDNKKY